MVKWALFPDCKVSVIVEKSINIIHHINRKNMTIKHDHLNKCRKKHYKIQHLFLEVEGTSSI